MKTMKSEFTKAALKEGPRDRLNLDQYREWCTAMNAHNKEKGRWVDERGGNDEFNHDGIDVIERMYTIHVNWADEQEKKRTEMESTDQSAETKYEYKVVRIDPVGGLTMQNFFMTMRPWM